MKHITNLRIVDMDTQAYSDGLQIRVDVELKDNSVLKVSDVPIKVQPPRQEEDEARAIWTVRYPFSEELKNEIIDATKEALKAFLGL